MGDAVHAHGLRITSASSISKQDAVIFASDSCLKLNTEVVKISPYTRELAVVPFGVYICTTNAAKYLGVWWNLSLSVKHFVIENINKARRTLVVS